MNSLEPFAASHVAVGLDVIENFRATRREAKLFADLSEFSVQFRP